MKGLDRVAAKPKAKLDQAQINLVEKKLALSGGILLIELGAELASRYGRWQEIMRKADDMLSTAQSIFDDEGKRNKEACKKMSAEGRQLKEVADEQRTKEKSHYTQLAEAYIVATYGEKKRDGYGKLVNYGDRIEIKENLHLKKLW